MPDFNSKLVKLYLAVGACVTVLFAFGAVSGWKAPDMPKSSGSGAGYMGRSSGGFWGSGK